MYWRNRRFLRPTVASSVDYHTENNADDKADDNADDKADDNADDNADDDADDSESLRVDAQPTCHDASRRSTRRRVSTKRLSL